MTTEMPKVKLPRWARFLRATGALRIRPTGYDTQRAEFICNVKFRMWHPLSLVLAFFMLLKVLAEEGFIGLSEQIKDGKTFFGSKEVRVPHG